MNVTQTQQYRSLSADIRNAIDQFIVFKKHTFDAIVARDVPRARYMAHKAYTHELVFATEGSYSPLEERDELIDFLIEENNELHEALKNNGIFDNVELRNLHDEMDRILYKKVKRSPEAFTPHKCPRLRACKVRLTYDT